MARKKYVAFNIGIENQWQEKSMLPGGAGTNAWVNFIPPVSDYEFCYRQTWADNFFLLVRNRKSANSWAHSAIANFAPACYGSSLGSKPDISQKYEMGGGSKRVANTL
jgi:hypothetical protein